MLIYINQFEMEGCHSFHPACKTIAGWLKNVTNRHFTVDELLSGNEFTINKIKVRTYYASEFSPKLYSILLSHPDNNVKGRQWITEIGIKIENDITIVSILLETSEISTLVRVLPNTTRPQLVTFLQRNGLLASSTVGLKINSIKNETEEFKALGYEIDRKERRYPIVFVSNCKSNNQPLVNPEKLQEQLIGLAQVVSTEGQINSWDLEEVLTRQYSAWDGAINIIYPSYNRGYCQSRLLFKENIIELIESGINIFQHVLSYITHTTNGYNKKLHFSPTDVRAKRQKDSRIKLKRRFIELSHDDEYQKLAEEAFEQLEEQDCVISDLKVQHENEIEEQMLSLIDTQDQLDQEKSEYHILKSRFNDLQSNSSKTGRAIITFGNETEKYKGEITDLVLDVLKGFIDSSKNQSRKQHLLQSILDCNSIDGTRDRYIEDLKLIFSNYNGMTPKIKSSLRSMGFEVLEDGNHNHLRFIGDVRYQAVFAKTPSDKRVGANIVRDIKAILL